MYNDYLCYVVIMILQNTVFIGSDHRLHTGDIQVLDDTIVRIEDTLSPSAGEDCMDCSGLLIIPALADCHVHSPDTILKGLFIGIEMTRWCDDSPQGTLQSRLFDYLDRIVPTPEFRTLVQYSYLQYFHHGVGFIVETGQADDSHEVLQSCAEEIGLKAVIDWYDQIPPEQPACTRLTTGIHLPEEEDLTEDALQSIVALRSRHPEKILMTHCLENTWRQQMMYQKFGMSTIQLMESHGLLDVRAMLFHCILADAADIALLAQRKATVVCCPVSSQRIGEGFMPVADMLAQGVQVTLGTDFLDHDMWDCMRFLYTELSTGKSQIPHLAQQVFAMANRNAAAIGHDIGYRGIIEVGSDADLCFLEHTHQFDPLIEEATFSNVLHNVINTGHASLVKHLMIQGRFVLRDGRCTTCNEDQVIAAYKQILIDQRW